MRVLVLTGSRVIPGLIDWLTPPDVEVEATNTFADALRQLDEEPPDGVVIDTALYEHMEGYVAPPNECSCEAFERACRCHSPPIPVLVESALYEAADLEAADACGRPPEDHNTLPQLKAELGRLLQEMDGGHH